MCVCAYASSTFAVPRTSSPPGRPRAHRDSWANRYASTIRTRAWGQTAATSGKHSTYTRLGTNSSHVRQTFYSDIILIHWTLFIYLFINFVNIVGMEIHEFKITTKYLKGFSFFSNIESPRIQVSTYMSIICKQWKFVTMNLKYITHIMSISNAIILIFYLKK